MTDDELIAEHMRTVGAVKAPIGFGSEAVAVSGYRHRKSVGGAGGEITSKYKGCDKKIKAAMIRETKKFPRVYEGQE